jgi:uncharacterized protein (TIGR02246 family)
MSIPKNKTINVSQDYKIKDNPGMNDEIQVRSVYKKLLDSWGSQNAHDFANLFTNDGNLIGLDGSQANGKKEITSHLTRVFNDHKTASYVSIIKEVRFITDDVAVLRAVAGMVPPGKSDINPEVNAIQTLIAHKEKDQFHIAVFQNTPAAFYGRPEARKQLTEELCKVLTAGLQMRH